ncbi:MAG: hypothetical protein U1E62_25590 [Alsobacter sp.]
MRFLSGLIFGVILTVLTAYMVDERAAPGQARMVDWQIVSHHVEEAKVQIRDGWDRLVATLDRTRSEPSKGDSAT